MDHITEILCKLFADVAIKRGIFQEHSLSALFFIAALIPLVAILKQAAQGSMFQHERKVNHQLLIDNLKPFTKYKK